ncbi:Calcium-dependent protein kinase 4 [Linnemannia schmuckeri]|uniref:Calcium-dependent protein kinase 4 n=1 Tax=Linnemannia schmuckeri TaxID=64567 RepID=A0A9P5VBS2_9FUNG|nr:Calcium-dependent protein kinase 4 [Linnemannia schmuckeri]
MAAMSISTTTSLYNPEPVVKYDLISTSLFYNSPTIVSSKPASSTSNITANSLRKSLALQRLHMGPPHRSFLPQTRQHHQQQPLPHPFFLHQIQHNHTNRKTQSTHLAGKLEDIMSNPLLIAPLLKEEAAAASAAAPTSPVSYVYTAPCEHHPSKGQTDYLVNDMFPKLTHDLSTIEFGIRIADFMPLAFKTVPVAGLAEKELQLLYGLVDVPNVIHLEDSFVNDNGDTVLVLPMLKKFDCHAVNKSICSVRKTMKQILTGLAAVHAKDIVHLDINPSNLMVTHAKKDIVIIDFGLSLPIDRSCKSGKPQVPICGTTGYIAPEVLRPQHYDVCDPTLADLYSLGIVLGQMLEPYIPDCDLHYFGSKYLGLENTNQTVAYLKDFIAQGAHYPRVLVQAADLLRSMLEENPKNRKSAQDLLDNHPFFSCSTESSTAATLGGSTLMLCDWLCRVQEIKYQKYLLQEQAGCEIYRYR